MEIVDNYNSDMANAQVPTTPSNDPSKYYVRRRDIRWFRALYFTGGSAAVAINSGAVIPVVDNKAVVASRGVFQTVDFYGEGAWEISVGSDDIASAGVPIGQVPAQIALVIPFSISSAAFKLGFGWSYSQAPPALRSVLKIRRVHISEIPFETPAVGGAPPTVMQVTLMMSGQFNNQTGQNGPAWFTNEAFSDQTLLLTVDGFSTYAGFTPKGNPAFQLPIRIPFSQFSSPNSVYSAIPADLTWTDDSPIKPPQLQSKFLYGPNKPGTAGPGDVIGGWLQVDSWSTNTVHGALSGFIEATVEPF